MNIHSQERREFPAMYGWLHLAVGVLFAIGAPSFAACQQTTSLAGDASLLSAILRAAISDAGQVDMRVDPRPLIADSELFDVQSDLIVPVARSVLRRRTAVIRAAGLRTVDATKVGQNKDCPGVFVMGRPDSLGIPAKSHGRCPKEAFDVLAIALPRPGADALPGDEAYDRDTESPARGYWAARVIHTALGQGGSSVKASDYVLARRAGKWVVVKIVVLAFSE
jgi:hypothetical protein